MSSCILSHKMKFSLKLYYIHYPDSQRYTLYKNLLFNIACKPHFDSGPGFQHKSVRSEEIIQFLHTQFRLFCFE